MRRWRRRRIVLAAPFVVVLLWAGVSYTVWTLQPTSMTWSEHSAEWVRNDVPFGNWLVDRGEHVYYTVNAPKTGGPQLKTLPAVGLTPARTRPPSQTSSPKAPAPASAPARSPEPPARARPAGVQAGLPAHAAR